MRPQTSMVVTTENMVQGKPESVLSSMNKTAIRTQEKLGEPVVALVLGSIPTRVPIPMWVFQEWKAFASRRGTGSSLMMEILVARYVVPAPVACWYCWDEAVIPCIKCGVCSECNREFRPICTEHVYTCQFRSVSG